MRSLPPLIVLALLATTPSRAQAPAQPEATQPAETPTGPASTLPACQVDRIFADLPGRAELEKQGLCFGLTDTNEVLGNTQGGVRHGTIYEGASLASVGVDLGAAGLIPGGTFYASAWQLRGHGLSTNNLYNIMVASSIDLRPARSPSKHRIGSSAIPQSNWT